MFASQALWSCLLATVSKGSYTGKQFPEASREQRLTTETHTIFCSIMAIYHLAPIYNHHLPVEVSVEIKGRVYPKPDTYFFLLPVVHFIHLDNFYVSCRVQYNSTRWNFASGAQIAPQKIK